MTEIVLDFAKLLNDAKAGAAWPEGDYDFEVIEAEAGVANTGSPQVRTKLRCLVGTYAGKTITNSFTLAVDSPIALKMFFRQMRGFGLDDNFFLQIGHGNLAPVAAALRGRRARITLANREWPPGSKELQNNITAVAAIDGALAGMPPGAMGGMPAGMPMPPQQFGAAPTPQPGYGGLDVFKQPDQQQPLPSGATFQPPQQFAPQQQPQMPPQMPPPQQPGMVPPPPATPLGQPQMPPPQQQFPQGYVLPVEQPPMNGTVAGQVAPVPAPPGYPPEVWATFPEETKAAILAAQGQSAPI